MLVKSFPLLTFLRFLCRIKGYMRKFCGGPVVRRLAAVLLPLMLLLAGCRPTPSDTSQPPDSGTPAQEMRGVWVSYLDIAPLLSGADPAAAAQALDEVMDTFSLLYLGKYDGKVCLLNYKGFYEPLLALLHHYVDQKMMSEETLNRLVVASTPEELLLKL